MLGTKHLIQNSFAVAAEVTPAASMLAEKMLAQRIRRRPFDRLLVELFSYSAAYKLRETNAAPTQSGSQRSLKFFWQPDRNGHY
jgi:hypothetical protein